MVELLGRQNLTVWVDMTNSPHVPFFQPVIRLLEERGHRVVVTARDYAQTKGLLAKSGLDYTLIGEHQGKRKWRKLLGLFQRAWLLNRYAKKQEKYAKKQEKHAKKQEKHAKKQEIDVAVSLGSNDLALVAFWRGIPHLTIFDYEYITAHHLNFRLSKLIMGPEAIPLAKVEKYGAKSSRFKHFPGLKENVYLGEFRPDPNFLAELGIPEHKVVLTLRPPATIAHYQSDENRLFDQLLDYLGTKENIVCVVLPRVKEQQEQIEAKAFANTLIPKEAVDGLNLLWWSDIVVSAGGTMNREAAALGVPVFSLYKDEFGAVDQMLVSDGRMVRISSESDFALLPLMAKRPTPDFGTFPSTAALIVDAIEELAKN